MMLSIQTGLAAAGGSIGLLYIIHWLLSWRKKISVAGKVVLITGANSGLGKALAFVFYQRGCHVILAGRSKPLLTQVKLEIQEQCPEFSNKLAVVEIDLVNQNHMSEAVAEAMAMFGRVDILVNNAGISYRGSIEATDIDVHVKVMVVNYFGQIALTKAILPYMLETGGGHIVAISTIQGRISQPYRSAYAASKHALQAYCDSLRAEMSDRNIHVCVVSPGYIQTNLSRNAMCGDGSNYGVLDKTTESGLPPDQVASIILRAVEQDTPELIPAPLLYRFVMVLRVIWPTLYFWVMAKRAKKQRKDYQKNR